MKAKLHYTLEGSGGKFSEGKPTAKFFYFVIA
jgi:hypothetical protein